MAGIHLIQILSDQTMQNVLPCLAFRPERVTYVCTTDKQERAARIQHALKQNEPADCRRFGSGTPDIEQSHELVFECIQEAREAGLTPLVNFTGGTKLMSIGAYSAAQADQAPSVYVDTANRQFVDGGTASGGTPGDPLSFDETLQQITVDLLVRANSGRKVDAGHSWESRRALALLLFEDPKLEEKTHAAVDKAVQRVLKGKRATTPAHWRTVAELDVGSVLQDAVRSSAIAAGVLNEEGRLPQHTLHELQQLEEADGQRGFLDRLNRARLPLEDALNFFKGTWWEVILAEGARNASLGDVRCGAIVGNELNNSALEEDVLAVSGVQLVYVSCKRGGNRARLRPHLEELHSRAEAIGGSFTRSFLAVYRPPGGNTLRELQRRSRELGVQLITPSEIQIASQGQVEIEAFG